MTLLEALATRTSYMELMKLVKSQTLSRDLDRVIAEGKVIEHKMQDGSEFELAKQGRGK